MTGYGGTSSPKGPKKQPKNALFCRLPTAEDGLAKNHKLRALALFMSDANSLAGTDAVGGVGGTIGGVALEGEDPDYASLIRATGTTVTTR